MLHPNQGFTYNKFEKPNDWPKIDKTFDYKIENGKLLSGNEHIYLSGPVTYNIVGNPTIVDGIVTDFTRTSYLMTNLQFDFSQTDYEFVIRATPHAVSTRNAAILGVYGGGLRIYFKQDSIECYPGNNTGLVVHSTFDVSSFYYVRLRRKGSVYTLDYSLDGINYTGARSVTSQQHSSSNLFIRFGYYSGDGWDPLDGKIDLNHTYIKVNDRLWFYGKNYTTYNMVPVPKGLEYNNTTTPEIGWVYTDTSPLKGPVNYTVVCEATITSGVVSNFSENNYIQLNNSQVSNIYSFESCIKIKFSPENLRGWFYQFGWFALSKYDRGSLEFLYRNEWDSWQAIRGAGTQTNIANTWIWIKAGCQNGTAYLSYSFDGKSYTTVGTNQYNLSTAQINANSPLGKSDSSRDLGNGSIDLNETYFIVNGKLWFGNYSMFQNFISVPEGTMIGKDDTHSLAVETYQDKGVVDYTVVGSLSIKDGVVSNFGDSNYLQISALPGAQDYFEPVNPFEMVLNVNTDTLTRAQYLYYGDFALSITASKNLQLYYYDSTAIWATGTATLQDNTSYDIKLTYDGANIIVSYKTGNNAYTQDIVATGQITKLADTETFGNRPTFNDIYLQGSLNLNHTYIMVNGQYWFHPYPNSYPKLVGPESYTEVGSPSITNGIITYTSDSDYIELNNQLTWDGSSDLEVYCRFKTPATFTDSNMSIISNESWTTPFVWVWGDSVYFQLPTTNISVSGVTTNTWYRIKIIGKNNTWTRILYIDDGTELAQVTSTESTGTAITMPIFIFRDYNGNRPVESVDLNNTYIKVNGCMWFGKEDWKPSIYTDNSIYLLAGHKTDYSSYNELDFTPTITNNDTYNVTIDNQEIFTNMSSGTNIEWNKLNLTTGYSITTPSALKTHIIKISPTDSTKHIIGYTCDYDESN